MSDLTAKLSDMGYVEQTEIDGERFFSAKGEGQGIEVHVIIQPENIVVAKSYDDRSREPVLVRFSRFDSGLIALLEHWTMR